jgi:hypothetical protein
MYYQRPPAGNPEAPQISPSVNEYLNTLQNVSPDVINLGLHAGKDILKKQQEKYMPGFFGFLTSLKYYFAVSGIFINTS